MTENPEIQYTLLVEDVNEQLSLILKRLYRVEVVAGRVQEQLEEVEPESIREAQVDHYLDRIERLDMRVQYLEKLLRNIGIHPDEDFTYSQILEMRVRLDRVPL